MSSSDIDVDGESFEVMFRVTARHRPRTRRRIRLTPQIVDIAGELEIGGARTSGPGESTGTIDAAIPAWRLVPVVLGTDSAGLLAAAGLSTQDGNGSYPRGTVELGKTDRWRAVDLPVTCPATHLGHQFVHLPQPRRAYRLAVGDESAVGVDRQRTAQRSNAAGNEVVLSPIGAEPDLGHMDDLGPRVGVLQLRDLHILGPDTRDLQRCPRRIDGRSRVVVG